MKPSRSAALLGKVRWRLTLSYLFVTLAAIFMLGWWGLVAALVYLQRLSPELTPLQLLQGRVLPVLAVVTPSALLLLLPASLVSAYFGFLTARWFDLRLSNLRAAVHAWQGGDFSVQAADPTADEIGAFAGELNAMAADLQRLLHARADLAVLEERTQLSRDLHDSVKQHITAAAFQISTAGALLEANPPAARASLEQAEDLVHTAHQELNTILFELRPVALQPGDLPKALRDYTAGWARQNPIAIAVEVQGQASLPPGFQQELLRFVQEALSNVARHSQATQVQVELQLHPEVLQLTIQDNGAGFQPENRRAEGYGLRTMRERIARLGGALTLTSAPGQGTQLSAAVPLQKEI